MKSLMLTLAVIASLAVTGVTFAGEGCTMCEGKKEKQGDKEKAPEQPTTEKPAEQG